MRRLFGVLAASVVTLVGVLLFSQLGNRSQVLADVGCGTNLQVLHCFAVGSSQPSLNAATFVDQNTGFQFNFIIQGDQLQPGQQISDEQGQPQEQSDQTGGNVNALLFGPALSLCSVHGPGGPGLNPNFSDGSGVFPLSTMECGRASGQTVSISGCSATGELHGFAHYDHPFVTYLGSSTIDFALSQTGARTGSGTFTFFTPKTSVTLSGLVRGPIFISTCQNPTQ